MRFYRPSYWIHPTYAGAATSYYRSVQFLGTAQVVTDPVQLAELLESLQRHYQPEGGYHPLDPADPLYVESLRRLRGVRLRPAETRTKWKLGQIRPGEVRRLVVAKLRERGPPGDLRAAEEVEKWIAGREIV